MLPDIQIRPMLPADLAVVTCIESAAQVFPWNEQMLADCLRTGYLAYVLEVQERVVGFTFIAIQVAECHILNIAIAPDMQGQGCGRHLMEFILNKARANKVKSVFLEVRISNSRAIKLYRNLGFNEIGQRRDYYQTVTGREDALVFALELLD